jgi:hypothetical protein
MAPAVHPSVGVWVGAVAAIAFVWDFRRLRDEFQPALKYFVAGCAVTLVSLVVQYTFIYHRTQADPAAVTRAFSTFVNVWDDHRRAAASTANVGVIFNRFVLAVGLIWLVGFARDLPLRSVFVLRVAVVAAAISLAFVFVSWLPPGSLPMTLSILMPARLLNFDVMIAVPLLLGLMGMYRQKLSVQFLMLILLTGVLFSKGSMFWAWAAEHQWSAWSMPVDPTLVLELTGLGLVCVALSNVSRSSTHARDSTARRFAGIAVRAATACVMLVAFGLTWRVAQPASLRDRTNDPFFREVAGDHRGLIVTAGTFQLVQLYTRRPVLIDSGALDTMVYAPESGPALAKILGDVYGIDFFNPPPEVRSASAVPHSISRANWAHMSREQWQQIRKTYNVTQIVARRDYVLDLPIAAETEQLRLYRIP